MSESIDFFVSYNNKDNEWAEWIAWQLEDAGYITIIQAWDFRPGGNFILDMQRASVEAQRTIAVLSQNYLDATYTQPEWAAALKQDPTGAEKTLLPVRVQECDIKGLLAPIVYIDLVGQPEDEARKVLLDGLKTDRVKPSSTPGFPQIGHPNQATQPTFPVAGSWGEQFLSPDERATILSINLNGNYESNVTGDGDIFKGDKQVIDSGGGAVIFGEVDTGGGDFVGRDQEITYSGVDPDAIAEAFRNIYQTLDQQPDSMQKDITQQALQTLEEEAKKGDQADEKKVQQGFEVILAMLPDIAEVAITTIINPAAGISTVFQKIAQKAKENL